MALILSVVLPGLLVRREPFYGIAAGARGIDPPQCETGKNSVKVVVLGAKMYDLKAF
jgi:hypothetical protein